MFKFKRSNNTSLIFDTWEFKSSRLLANSKLVISGAAHFGMLDLDSANTRPHLATKLRATMHERKLLIWFCDSPKMSLEPNGDGRWPQDNLNCLQPTRYERRDDRETNS